MTDYTFTPQDVLNKVIEIGNRFPDFNYRAQTTPNHSISCRYLSAGFDYSTEQEIPGQGCIVGQALRALGVSKEVLREYEGLAVYNVLLRLLDHEYLAFEKGINSLTLIQDRQDSGCTWGEAVSNVMV